LRETPHQGRLFEEAQAAAPEGAVVLKAPALRLSQREVSVSVSVSKDLLDSWEYLAKDAAADFRTRTGFELVWDRPDAKPQTRVAKKHADAWEINRAYGEIRTAFRDQPQVPSKLGMKDGVYIEAAFISPAVGERYRDLLNQVSEKIGWEIRIRPSANQEQISQMARSITPEACAVRGSSKIFPDRVVVPVVIAPNEADREALVAQFCEATGFDIDWETPKA